MLFYVLSRTVHSLSTENPASLRKRRARLSLFFSPLASVQLQERSRLVNSSYTHIAVNNTTCDLLWGRRAANRRLKTSLPRKCGKMGSSSGRRRWLRPFWPWKARMAFLALLLIAGKETLMHFACVSLFFLSLHRNLICFVCVFCEDLRKLSFSQQRRMHARDE